MAGEYTRMGGGDNRRERDARGVRMPQIGRVLPLAAVRAMAEGAAMHVLSARYVALVASLLGLAGCRTPTQVTLEISTDLDCGELQGTTITVGTLDSIECSPEATETFQCEAGRIGSLVVVPSGALNEEFAVKVVTGVTLPPPVPDATCTASSNPPDYLGTIVARRALRFIPHTELTLPIVMQRACEGVACVADATTCNQGSCVAATIQDPGVCAELGGCGGSSSATSSSGAGSSSGTGGSCSATTAACAGSCVDTSSDATNCGSCGHDCQGGACQGSVCQPVTLAASQNPQAIAVDATSVYWTNYAMPTGTVMKMALSGGTPTTLASDQSTQLGIAVDATSVYWTNYNTGTVMKVGLGGGTPTTLASGLSLPDCMAVDATSVYWTGNGDLDDATVMKVAIGGGTPTTLASGQSETGMIAVDATSAYWTDFTGGTVMKVAIGGGTPTTLVAAQGAPAGIAVDATSVYWTNDDDGTVMKVGLDGGTPTTLASGLSGPYFLALDATRLYWTNSDGTVRAVAIGGGTPIVLASTQSAPNGIAVDATSVYWTTSSTSGSGSMNGSVMKVAK
jgi:hypothetical protein